MTAIFKARRLGKRLTNDADGLDTNTPTSVLFLSSLLLFRPMNTQKNWTHTLAHPRREWCPDNPDGSVYRVVDSVVMNGHRVRSAGAANLVAPTLVAVKREIH